MRDIKFRAWDKINKKWIKNFNIDLLNIDVSELPNIEIMQYTGLNDKNGKEIYEGDIVEVDDCYYEVYFDDGFFKAEIKFYIITDLFEVVEQGCEIIGSIHENPELLEE